ncbi:hypothetical protein BGLA2_1720084 [Burkholderia gladioli]|nr:hypothetical protein BGLA2_1720084 [Burkholderia gladioli]
MSYNSTGNIPTIARLEIEHMARKIDSINPDDVALLRSQGMTAEDIADQLGVSKALLYKRGLMAAPTAIQARIDRLDGKALRARHEAGESVLTLSKEFAVSRAIIATSIKAAGGTIRDQSAANKLVASNKTPEQHRNGVQAAHEARRKTGSSLSEKIKRANRRSAEVGQGETELIAALRARGYEPEGQLPCGPYNIDIAFLSVAVELMTLSSDPRKLTFHTNRVKYLRDAGYCTVIIRFRHNRLDNVIGNLDDIITFLEIASRDPATRRQDWVIECRSKRFSRARDNHGKFAVIPTPVSYFHTIREWDL